MNIYIIIPAHNEESLIANTLKSLVTQTLLPKKIVVVNDHSTDQTEAIVNKFVAEYPFVSIVNNHSSSDHMPGSKVVNAFYRGLETLDKKYDIICKFDADLIFNANYLEKLVEHFEKDDQIGMVGGFCYIQKENEWVFENLTNKDHIRGALKAYKNECFEDIGGLKPAMGWDTVDELLAQYHDWKIVTDESLRVKHLKPTGNIYNSKAKYKQGEAFYKMRYGFGITVIASIKLALLKKQPGLIKDYIFGFLKAKIENQPYLISEAQGEFIRKLRWNNIKHKLNPRAKYMTANEEKNEVL